jgi:hypothetical protein
MAKCAGSDFPGDLRVPYTPKLFISAVGAAGNLSRNNELRIRAAIDEQISTAQDFYFKCLGKLMV